MALRYFINGGIDNNWGSISNWATQSGGTGGQTVPTNADDVFFTGVSPNCTVNVPSPVCKTLSFTASGSGYTNTIAMQNNIIVGQTGVAASGSITLHGGMTTANVSGVGYLVNNIAATTPTLTSNGGIWGGNYRIGSSTTVTLADNWSVNDFDSTVATPTINGNTLTVRGNLTTTSTFNGTTTILMGGTGSQTWSAGANGYVNTPLTINKPSGSLTISGTVYYSSTTVAKTLTYIAGDVITTGSTLTIQGLCTLNTSGMTFSNVNCIGAAISTITLTSNLNISGNFATAQQPINGLFTITVGGSLNVTGSGNDGTATILMNGTGTLTSINSTAFLRNNLTINTSGTITIGIFAIANKTFTHIAGADGSSAFLYTAATVNLNSLFINNYFPVNTGVLTTTTLLSPIYVNNFATIAGGGVLNGSTVYIAGNITITTGSGSLTGTTNIIVNGTGDQTWSHGTAGAYLSLGSLAVNKSSGIFIISGPVYFTGFLFVSSPIQSIGSILTSNAATQFTMNGESLGSLTLGGASITYTFNDDMVITGLLTINGLSNMIFNGSKVYVNSLNHTGSNQLNGTSELIFYGNGTGTWANATAALHQLKTTINCGKLVLGARVNFSNATLTYIRGYVDAFTNKNVFYMNNASGTLINCNQINFNRIIIAAGNTITMNEFFSGSPGKITNITSSTTTNYTIQFTDNIQKYSKFITMTYCTLSKKGQVLVITDSKKSNTNIGLRYFNSLANGIPVDRPSINLPSTFGAGGLAGDPSMEKYF
jgi:hypothetical protein